jgi:N-acetylglucosamine repressor
MGAKTGLRPALARQLGMSLMSVGRIVREFIQIGVIREQAQTAAPAAGRPAKELSVNPSAAYVLGLELHAYRQSMVIADLSGAVIRSVDFALSDPTDGPRTLDEVAGQMQEQIRAAGIDPIRVMGAVVGMTGIIDREQGVAIDSPYLGWSSLDVAAPLRKRLNIPVLVDRISSVLLTAEARRSPGLSDGFLINVGFAMSASFLVDGAIVFGDRQMAGQIAHVTSDDRKHRCPCGQWGCLNVSASGWSALVDIGWITDLVVSAEEFQRDRAKLSRLLAQEEQGDAAACQALRTAGQTLGRAIKPLQAALDPARIFLAGPVGRAASYADGVRDSLDDATAALVSRCMIKVDEAAAITAFDEFIRSPQLDFARLRQAQAKWRQSAKRSRRPRSFAA